LESSTNNTYVFDPESPTELARLINQDRIVTQAMGGPLSGLSDPSNLRNIVDLGCGPGGWVLDVAFALPDAEVEGVDVSRTMVDYANARARTQQLPNASFGVMDLTQPLEFPDASFDLVNERYLGAVLKREAWPSFLSECTRVLRPGGILRLTELVEGGITSSAAVNHFMRLITQALWQAGYGFSPDGHSVGITHALPRLLRERGYEQIRLVGHALEHSVETEAWMDQYRNIEVGGQQLKPFLLKLGLITPEALDQLHQQCLIDMLRDEFCGMMYLLTVLARKPSES
jgi:SAM-dependent methyltransferase